MEKIKEGLYYERINDLHGFFDRKDKRGIAMYFSCKAYFKEQAKSEAVDAIKKLKDGKG